MTSVLMCIAIKIAWKIYFNPTCWNVLDYKKASCECEDGCKYANWRHVCVNIKKVKTQEVGKFCIGSQEFIFKDKLSIILIFMTKIPVKISTPSLYHQNIFWKSSRGV